jgi:aminopeptidase YwaD
VIARKNPESRQKIVVTAHIDAYEDTPGASDNASGTVVLMLLAEMLAGYTGSAGIEIAALNGEDHYSAGGQMDYLGRYAREFGDIVVAINVDDVGYRKGRAAFSFYECPPEIRRKAEMTFGAYDGLVQGDPWFNGDHMIFVQNGVPSMAFTAEELSELMATITHTPRDTPEIVDLARLVEVARALESFIKRL